MLQRVWEAVPCDTSQVDVVARELAVSPTVARLLCIRGLGDLDLARRFLSPSLNDLHDPFLLTDMAPAVERILGAVARKERIAIHGDYDVDGVTSTVILRRALELLGADVTHFIPERLRDGYGLQTPALDRLHAEGVRLVISVDWGIRAAEPRASHGARTRPLLADHQKPARCSAGAGRINPSARLQYPTKTGGLACLDVVSAWAQNAPGHGTGVRKIGAIEPCRLSLVVNRIQLGLIFRATSS